MIYLYLFITFFEIGIFGFGGGIILLIVNIGPTGILLEEVR